MSHDWTLGVIYEQIFSLLLGLFDWMSLRLKRIDEEIARICLYCSFLCFLIFASQVSDSLALIYPLADLVGAPLPSSGR